jgi:hypothetical protein
MKRRSETISAADALSPYKTTRWKELTPAERLRSSWAARKQLLDPQAVHDRKLFSKALSRAVSLTC